MRTLIYGFRKYQDKYIHRRLELICRLLHEDGFRALDRFWHHGENC